MRMGRPPFPVPTVAVFWEAVRSGLLVDDAAVVAGVSRPTAWRLFAASGGVMPPMPQPPAHPVSRSRLTLAEREDIACLRAAKLGVRAIARELGRDPGTISRELARNDSYDGRYRIDQVARWSLRLPTAAPLRAPIFELRKPCPPPLNSTPSARNSP